MAIRAQAPIANNGADNDADIRADLLSESGELLARLSQQLVDFEKQPNSPGLLDAIFRAFHTLKGGAGFLGVEAMVVLCHAAEEVLDALRKRQRSVDPELMDAVLEALDCVQTMHAAVADNRKPAPAPAGLIERLRKCVRQPRPCGQPASAETTPAIVVEPKTDTISDDEFEALLDQLHGAGKAPGAVVADLLATPPIAEVAVEATQPAAADTSVRVETVTLDQMMNLVGELVLVRNRLKRLGGQPDATAQARAIVELDHVVRALQSSVTRVRMQPIRRLFARFPRLAREIARDLGKQVEVELCDENTGLDKTLIGALADPLVHMVRNSVDHGIEQPQQRVAAGKPACGHLRLNAQQAGEEILISVEDDGAGMNPERLRQKAFEKGLIDADAAARLSASECLQLIFLPGFSTKEQVSEVSGRGVGMDVVKSAITRLGGTVQIDSQLGVGSCIRLRVPLTLAILPALMVAVGPRMLALPLSQVREVIEFPSTCRVRGEAADVLVHRKETLKLVHLHRWLVLPMTDDEPRRIVTALVEGRQYGFVVSQVQVREDVVVKPLGTLLRGVPGICGAAVTSSGRAALILDLPRLAGVLA